MWNIVLWLLATVYFVMAFRAFKRVIWVGLNGPDSDINDDAAMKFFLLLGALGAAIVAPAYWAVVFITSSDAMKTADERQADIRAQEEELRKAQAVIAEWDAKQGKDSV